MDLKPKQLRLMQEGSSLIEILLSFAIVAVSIVGSVQVVLQSQKIVAKGELYHLLKNRALTTLSFQKQKQFDELSSASATSEHFTESVFVTNLDNYTKEVEIEVSSGYGMSFEQKILRYNFDESRGAENCSFDLPGNWAEPQIRSSISLGTGIVGTGVVVRGAKAFVSADSATLSKDDLFVVDISDLDHPVKLSSLNTGPGLQKIAHTGKHIFGANTSINAQLQVIDVSDSENLQIVAELKLPHPDASTTPGVSRSIHFKNDVIYLGTTKNTGKELHFIDVKNPSSPHYITGIETDTLVSSIETSEHILYIATPTIHQVRAYDIEEILYPHVLNAVSLAGWQTQEGKRLYRFLNHLYMGRSVGGFNNAHNHELFDFLHSTTSPLASGYESVDVASSVNALIVRPPFVYIGTSDPTKEFQVWNLEPLSLTASIDLSAPVADITCGGGYIYAALAGTETLVILEGSDE